MDVEVGVGVEVGVEVEVEVGVGVGVGVTSIDVCVAVAVAVAVAGDGGSFAVDGSFAADSFLADFSVGFAPFPLAIPLSAVCLVADDGDGGGGVANIEADLLANVDIIFFSVNAASVAKSLTLLTGTAKCEVVVYKGCPRLALRYCLQHSGSGRDEDNKNKARAHCTRLWAASTLNIFSTDSVWIRPYCFDQ